MFRIVLLNLYFISCVSGYYLPGVSPRSYENGEDIPLLVSKLTSTKTQMPYEYYTLPYCKPKNADLQSENIGEALSGDRIENSVYKLSSRMDNACEVACVKILTTKDKNAFIDAIEDEYRVHWIADGLPVGQYDSEDSKTFQRGFPVGYKSTSAVASVTSAMKNSKKPRPFTTASTGTDTAKYYLNNHVKIIIEFNDDHYTNPNTDHPLSARLGSETKAPTTSAAAVYTARVVNFRVEPFSVQHTWSEEGDYVHGKSTLTTCSKNKGRLNTAAPFRIVRGKSSVQVVFTYEVSWQRSELPWSHRWDLYLTASNPNDRVHWFSISNSIVIALFLSVTIGTILLRALRTDIAKYNDANSIEEAREETGWKLVHGDVFRAPVTYPMLFSVFVGSGMQLFLMVVATLFFSFVGLLSPANRGSLTSGLLILYVCMGSFAGYFSSVTYKMFRGTDWRRNTVLTAILFPGLVFTGFFFLNGILFWEGSSAAVPFSTFFKLIFLWLCVSVPLVVLGSFFGYKREVIAHPVRTNQIPRAIPPQQWYLNPFITTALGGILPFGAVAVELYFMMSALWLHQIYYIFGFLFLVLIVLVVTCAEVAILMTYFQLCLEDYHWWWRSFFTAGACAFYLFFYSIWYNMTQLNITGMVPTLIYFTYMSLASFTFFLVTGTIGFVCSFCFNTVIYGSIKVD